MQKFSTLVLSLSLVLLSACAMGGKDERYELKNYYSTGAYELGLKYLEASKFFNSPDEKLLQLYEKGTFLHAIGKFEESSKVFEEAKQLAQEMYTISISKKAEKAVLNDNYDKYYGEIYEHSMVFYYSSLNYLQLHFQTGNRDYLFKARADILGWDSFLNSIQEDRLGKTVYKKDLLLKLYGAKIHELIGTREDEQIAINLYKEAEDVLFKNYNSYRSFNELSSEFIKDYEKLATLKIPDVKKKYIKETDDAIALKKFIQNSIDNLQNKKKVTKANKGDNKVENDSLKKEHLTIVLEQNLIAEKIADKTQFQLAGLSNEPFLRLFVADVLGLLPGPANYNPGGVYAGVVTADAAMKLFTFGFELPKVKNVRNFSPHFLIVKDANNSEVLKKELPLVNPMGDIAEEAITESSTAVYARVGARLATKHIAAIMASFGTYKALGGGRDKENLWAKNAAILQYAAATRIIEESERADTRYWSTLPNEIRMTDIDLNPGEYNLFLENGHPELTSLGKLKIISNNPQRIFKLRK